MCWNDFVSYMEGGQQGDDESSISTESQDTPLLRDTPSNSSFAAHNNRSLLITPSRVDSRPDPAAEKLDRLSALSCLDPETPLPRKRHPMTIMRTMSERSLDRGRTSQLLNLLSERAQARAATKLATSCNKPPPPPPPIVTLPSVERTLEAARENARVSLNKNETKRREAVWDLFQSECAFLYDHLMVLKNVSVRCWLALKAERSFTFVVGLRYLVL